jgi:1,4-alpha-glucan branching enzyme
MNHVASRGAPDHGAIDAILFARHGDPFAVLGPHEVEGGCAVRAFLPDATAVEVVAREDDHVLATLERIDLAGFWSGLTAANVPYRLRITSGDLVRVTEDPYAFGPALGEMDIYLLAEGRHQQVGRTLGAHLMEHEGVPGVRFAVWAPNARRVSVVGDFNAWDGRRHPMRQHIGAGVWELFIPRMLSGTLYKYEIVGPDNNVLPLKADPVAGAAERPPATASIVIDEDLSWTDEAWFTHRAAAQAANAPISVYEVHAPSWLQATEDGGDGWIQLAEKLVPYIKGMGFTHVELMPVMEHPFGGSWGYQPLGQYAPSARMGSPEGFAYLVDRCHDAGIGVILDWVPAHFPTDAHGLARFDGTPLYEHADPREGFHHDWNTYIFNLGRNEVRAFLIGSAVHWLEHYHADGLRVDAVASMLYRDYSRKSGEWVPNQYGGRENLEAVSFLQELSRVVRERCPGAVLIAEESTAWPGVSRDADEGGLGFNFKWNMGWMHDTLHYMEEEPINRRWHHDEITFGLIYAFSEKFLLPLSHDEVVYGKGSMIRKMPGDDWQKFANLRAYYGFMWSHPGKKLIFMGAEIAQWSEWNHDASLDWYLLDAPVHSGMQRLIRDLNHVYRGTPALYRNDTEVDGFRWVVIDDREQSVFVYLRFGDAGDAPVLVACNFTPVPRHGYRVGLPHAGYWREILNTDSDIYGGSNLGNGGGLMAEALESHGFPASMVIELPPLATIMFQAG